MTLFLYLLLLRLLKKDPLRINTFYGCVQDLLLVGQLTTIGLILSLVSKACVIPFYLCTGLYLLIDFLLYQKTNLRLEPILFTQIRSATSYRSSVGIKEALSLSLHFCLITFFCIIDSLVLYPWILIPAALALLSCLFQTSRHIKLGNQSNILIDLQISLVKRLVSTKKAIPKNPHLDFKNEVSVFPDPKYPLYRITNRFKGPSLFSVDTQDKPHIILLFMESFRAKNVGVIGSGEPLSPCFDALSKKGILFDNYYSCGNLTHTALFTSLCGVPMPLNSYLLPKTKYLSIAQIASGMGYYPAFITGGNKSFLNQDAFLNNHGYKKQYGIHQIRKQFPDEKFSSWGIDDARLLRYSAQYLQQQSTPQFLTIATQSNHHPWTLPPNELNIKETLSSHPLENQFLKTFAYSDDCLGQFVKDLEERNLSKNTVLWICADHGSVFSKNLTNLNNFNDLHNDSIHIPLLIYAEGRIQEPRRIHQLGSGLDLMPTMMDVHQFHGPQHGFGTSLKRELPKDREVYFYNSSHIPNLGIRESNWKYIHNYKSNESKLFDLETDPDERQNLSSTHPEKQQEFKKKALQRADYFSHLDANELFFPKEDGNPSKDSSLILCSSTVDDKQAIEQIEQSQNLCVLNLSNSMITDHTLEKIAAHCPSLSRLSLSHCYLITEEGIRKLLGCLHQLEDLFIDGHNLTSKVFETTLPDLSLLSILDAEELFDPFLFDCFPRLSLLKGLDLNCQNITDKGISHLADHSSLFQVTLQNAHQISPEALASIIEGSRNLWHLQIEDSPFDLDLLFQKLETHPIGCLSLKCCTTSIKGLKNIEIGLLRNLYFDSCPNITDTDLFPLLERTPEITIINCPNVSKKFLLALSEKKEPLKNSAKELERV